MSLLLRRNQQIMSWLLGATTFLSLKQILNWACSPLFVLAAPQGDQQWPDKHIFFIEGALSRQARYIYEHCLLPESFPASSYPQIDQLQPAKKAQTSNKNGQSNMHTIVHFMLDPNKPDKYNLYSLHKFMKALEPVQSVWILFRELVWFPWDCTHWPYAPVLCCTSCLAMPLDADILKKPVGTCCLNVAISEKEILGHFGAILSQNSFFFLMRFLWGQIRGVSFS